MTNIRRSVCALDCPDTCGVLVHLDEQARATKLTGDPDHPVTRGFLCGKVTQYLEREYHPDRLLYPLRRIGAKGEGRFERIDWDEALDTIAQRLGAIAERSGSEAILPYSYAGTMGLLNGSGMDRRFFHRLGASRLDRTICSSAGGAALTASLGITVRHRAGAVPPCEADHRLGREHSRHECRTCGRLLWRRAARARSSTSSIRTAIARARLADRHFAINPGTDAGAGAWR